MWLIADSGSTKTEWVFFNAEGEKKQIYSKGLNPFFLSKLQFTSTLLSTIPKDWINRVRKIWFYSAGCGTNKRNKETKKWLEEVFINAKITVYSDLMASARATCGTNKGVVAILGTGSNSCYFDGESISHHIHSLGYIFGDEGSGFSLGKSLLKMLIRNQLPTRLSNAIAKDIGMEYDEIIHNIYTIKYPNCFIASFAKTVYTHKEVPEIKQLIYSEFDRFVSILLSYGLEYPINFVGSVAFFFKPYLEESLCKKKLKLGKVFKSPTEQLVDYHLKNND